MDGFVGGLLLDGHWMTELGRLDDYVVIQVCESSDSSDQLRKSTAKDWMIRKMGWMKGLPFFQHTNIARIVSKGRVASSWSSLRPLSLPLWWLPTPKDQCYIYMGLSEK